MYCLKVLIVVVLMESGGAVESPESKLFARLLQNYNKDLRPVIKHTDKIDVQVDFGLTQIINMDEKHQVLIWNGWVRQRWNDYRLAWNRSEFDNTNDISMDKEFIWTPDLALYNNAKENFQLFNAESFEKIIVGYQGNCLWMVPFVFRTICQLDIKYFPFDEQHCSFEVGSWAYTGNVFNISFPRPRGDLSEYRENSAWRVLKIDAELKIGYYKCCPEPYPSVIYKMHLRRRSRHYIYKIFIPSSLIAVLAIFSFFLPTSSGERVTLLITNFVSLAFFIMMLTDLVPPTSEATPLIEIYLTAVFIEICAALILRCFIDVAKRKRHSPGWVIRTIVNRYLATILRVRHESIDAIATEEDRSWDDLKLENIDLDILSEIEVIRENRNRGWRDGPRLRHARAVNNGNCSSANANAHFYGDHMNISFCDDEIQEEVAQPAEENTSFRAKVISSLEIISGSVIQKHIAKMRRKEIDKTVKKLDKFFFWLFTLAMSGTLLFIFITPPNLVF